MNICLSFQENRQVEDFVVNLYNDAVTDDDKIHLVNLENPYLFYDAEDKHGRKYEIKSVGHLYGNFAGEYCPILKLAKTDKTGLRLIYHFLDNSLYYFDYNGENSIDNWVSASKKTMLYIPIKNLKLLSKKAFCFLDF